MARPWALTAQRRRSETHGSLRPAATLRPRTTWEEVEYDLVYTKMDRHCAHDRFLAALCETVKLEAERKMEAGNVDLESVRRRVGKGP
jgi:hypothetical protein